MPGNYDAFIGPDLARIELGDFRATADAIFYLTKKLEEEATIRARDDRNQGMVGAAGETGIRWSLGPWVLTRPGAVLRPAVLTSATYNDYNPSGIDACILLDLEPSGVNPTITGIATNNRDVYRFLHVANRDSTRKITLTHQGAGSTAAYRFDLPENQNMVLGPREGGTLFYDPPRGNWRMLEAPQESGGVRAILEVRSAELVLTEAQLESGNTTPIEIVAAQGAGKIILPVEHYVELIVTTGYTSSPSFNLVHDGQALSLAVNISPNWGVVATTRNRQIVSSATPTYDPANLSLKVRLSADPGTPGTGVATAKVGVAYYVLSGF